MRTMRRVRRPSATLALLLAAGGCSSSSTSPGDRDPNAAQLADVVRVRECAGPATNLPADLAAALPPRTGMMRPDDQWADLAAEVPGGFAGVVYDQGRPVLLLTRPAEAAAAKQALAPHLTGFDVANAEVRQARWDFAQLVDWYNYLTGRGVWGPGSGVTTGDKDESANRIVYGVADEAARDRLAASLAALDLPCDLVLLKIQAPVVLDALPGK
ncbi:MAG: hypothetical protein ACJ79S_16870 [Gemmatimonadaceae bacterium]